MEPGSTYTSARWLDSELRQAGTDFDIRWILRNILVTYVSSVEKDPYTMDGAVWCSAVEFMKRGYHHQKKYPFLGRGSCRFTVQTGPRSVLKVPLSPAGVLANRREAGRYFWSQRESIFWGDKLAPCHLWGNGWLSMIRVEPLPLNELDTLPPWAKSIDCQQVGRGPSGRLLAYDYDRE